MAKVALNTMVAEETLSAIRRLAVGKSQGQVVDEVIAAVGKASEGPDLVQKVYERLLGVELKLEEILETVQSVPAPTSSEVSSTSDPASIPGVSAGPPKRYGCGHCGAQKVVARVGEICASCAGTDHRGEPRDCPECAMGAGTGAL